MDFFISENESIFDHKSCWNLEKVQFYAYSEIGSIQYTCLLRDVTSVLDLIRLLCIPLAYVQSNNSLLFMYIHDLRVLRFDVI